MVESPPRPAPSTFWLASGRIDELAVGVTAFLVIVAAAVEYLPRATQGVHGRELGPRADVKRRWWPPWHRRRARQMDADPRWCFEVSGV